MFCACQGLTQLADATELLVMSFLSSQMPCIWHSVGAAQTNLLSTAIFVGMLVGAFGGGHFADHFGRRLSYIVMTALVGGFGMLSAAMPNIGALSAARLLVGVGLGAAPAALSLYSEFLPQHQRGANILSFFAFFSVGAVVEALIAWLTLDLLSLTSGWRAMLVVSALPGVVLCVIALAGGVPESPRFLLVRGDVAGAQRLLARVAAENGVTLPPGRLVRTVVSARVVLHRDRCDSDEDGGGVVERGSLLHTPVRSAVSPSAFTSVVVAPKPHAGLSRVDSDGDDDGGNDDGGVDGDSADMRGTIRSLLRDAYLRRCLAVLCCMFFLMAVLYYVLVLLTNNIVVDANTKSDKGAGNCVRMRSRDYGIAVLVNGAEIVGLVIAVVLVGRIGRRHTVSSMFAACGVTTLVLYALPHGNAAIVALFLARAFALAFNQSLWVLSCEVRSCVYRGVCVSVFLSHDHRGCVCACVCVCVRVYVCVRVWCVHLCTRRDCALCVRALDVVQAFPTAVRTVGVGTATSFARIGGALAPSLCSAFSDNMRGAMLVCSAVAAVSAIVVLWFPHETANRRLEDTVGGAVSVAADSARWWCQRRRLRSDSETELVPRTPAQ